VQRLCDDPLTAWGADGITLPYTMSMAEAWVDHARDSFARREMIALAVTLAATDEVVGDVCLEGLAPGREPAVGYIIAPAHRGRGYAGEAAGRMVRYAFEELNLPRLTAQCFDRNEPSKRVLTGLGFRVVRVRPGAVRRADRLEDDVDFELTREAWETTARASEGESRGQPG